ncbi:PTS system mannose/fructose/sorbose family IID component [Tepidanaerobacter acetatoxydans Re1]|uniref:PTS system mannose/fructose/sorbose family IID component n=1 Tax=Tepidanaerobacter acetatoxydans (strain DSM 21804 / JCM 16047 / Re1) TaxID=1209989 RepID=F4LX61_TEPAE|nr:PTS system mannose/fructose/sorbose family transporter subunit IID [Tepidanaerobacter acetatoxydans]AEE91860.1 PTS system mannose/fructose/sorbose family IID component [Tepidanaerobacter acetatoxydans Re1]CCP26668.1 PTS system mannose/fructose/sorbose family IID component [Tepidanaerobacter acetatoxydans Re1]
MEKKISEKTLKKSFLNWFFWNGCSQQAESMLGMAFGQSMAPVIEELYDTKEERSEALKRHITLYNSESQVGSIVNGIVCGLEEANANKACTPELISSVKVALIGPTSAIGDSLWVATIIPILLTIALSISQASANISWIGSLLYMIVYPVGTFLLSWYLFKIGYKSGLEGMQTFMADGTLNKLTDAMTVLGLIVVGALTASFVNMPLPIQIVRDIYDATTNTVIPNQVIFNADNMINSIFPKLLPLSLTLAVYYLYSKKKWSPLKLMGLILALAAVLTALGYWTGFYA